ncbi:hypothetical protein CPB86DRAFT_816073 [Serendipita vermifera]|nr:hypothetical protein CPB86DRAFT_816073 [Serendipita vermifera]
MSSKMRGRSTTASSTSSLGSRSQAQINLPRRSRSTPRMANPTGSSSPVLPTSVSTANEPILYSSFASSQSFTSLHPPEGKRRLSAFASKFKFFKARRMGTNSVDHDVEPLSGLLVSRSVDNKLTRTMPHDSAPSLHSATRRRATLVDSTRARLSRFKTAPSHDDESVPPVPTIGLGIVGLHYEPTTGKYTFRDETNSNSKSGEGLGNKEENRLTSSSPMERRGDASSASSSDGSRFSSASSAFASSEGEECAITPSATFQVSAPSCTMSNVYNDQEEEMCNASNEILDVLFGGKEMNNVRTSRRFSYGVPLGEGSSPVLGPTISCDSLEPFISFSLSTGHTRLAQPDERSYGRRRSSTCVVGQMNAHRRQGSSGFSYHRRPTKSDASSAMVSRSEIIRSNIIRIRDGLDSMQISPSKTISESDSYSQFSYMLDIEGLARLAE